MKKLLLISIAAIVLQACSSGKAALEKGDYDKAFYKSVERLKRNGDNRKANNVYVKAYDLAIERHLRSIDQAKLSADVYRWEKIAERYQALNFMADAVNNCPSCLDLVSAPTYYTIELNEAKYKAAEVRYALGDKAMQQGTRLAAKDAYFHYLTANSLAAGFKDALEKAEDARWEATIKVVVQAEPVGIRRFELSNDFFMSKIEEFFNDYNRKADFVRFFSDEEFQRTGLKSPDQVLLIGFDEFTIGQTLLKERNFDVESDTVVVGKQNGKDVYGKVKANVTTFRKEVSSAGLLDFRVIDPQTNKILTIEKFPGTFVWIHEWATFKGDERALKSEHKTLLKNRDLPPPPPQALFVEFTRPIFTQLTGKVVNYYKRY